MATTITVSSQAQLDAAIEQADQASSGTFDIVLSGNITRRAVGTARRIVCARPFDGCQRHHQRRRSDDFRRRRGWRSGRYCRQGQHQRPDD